VSRAIGTSELDALYAKLKPKGVTVSALLAKAVGVTLAKHPIMNAAYAEDAIKYNANIDVAMAVALPDGVSATPPPASPPNTQSPPHRPPYTAHAPTVTHPLSGRGALTPPPTSPPLQQGLVTPTMRSADTNDLYSISREWKDMVGRTMEGKLKPSEMGGTFTVSNLGMFGVSDFVSILPPGTGAILAVAASTPTFVQQKNGMLLGTLEPCP
jgi:pyruvate dehydrogenase E2 component (dihydrolipoamide acetyltransferase)